MRICFTADSTCDVDQSFLGKYPAEIIPLTIELDGVYYRDGIDINPDKIITAVNQGSPLPKTSAPNTEEYRNAFTRLLKDHDSVIHFSLGSGFSSSFQNARLGAEGLPVHVIDTGNLHTGIALLMCETWDRLRSGMTLEQTLTEVTALTSRVDVSFIVDRLDFLHKGGRCSTVSLLGANLLHIRPSIKVTDGAMQLEHKYRGTYESCARHYLADLLRNKSSIDTRRIFIGHTGLTPLAMQEIRSFIQKEIGFAETIEVRAGSTITSHCGNNCLGIALLRV